MKGFLNILGPVLPTAALLAASPGGATLDYRIKVVEREGAVAQEHAFRLVTTPALVTRNKVQKPRLGGWRIEPVGPAPSAFLMTRILGLCYFAGPGTQVVPLPSGIRLGRRWCRLWQVRTPPGVAAYAYLAEVAPGLLALDYLSAKLPDGDPRGPRSLEMRLEGADLGARVAPAEEGAALLRTLEHWAAPQPEAPADPDAVETEPVD
jgi:hypothetical protein